MNGGLAYQGSLHKAVGLLLAVACATSNLAACTRPSSTASPAESASVTQEVDSTGQSEPGGEVEATKPDYTDTAANYETTVTAEQGGTLIAEEFEIAFAPGALPQDTIVSATPVENPPPLVTEALIAEGVDPADYVMVSQVYDIDAGGEPLATPAVVMVHYDIAEIPAGRTPADLKIVQFVDGEWGVLETAYDPSTQMLIAETDHFSMLAIAVAFTLIGITSMALVSVIAGQKRSLTDPRYLQPDKVDVSGFSVDKSGRRLTLDKPVVVVDRGSSAKPKAAAAMMAEPNPTGMCIDFSNLFGSLLIKMGYPVRIVSGSATYEGKNGPVRGGHLWAETMIDGEPFYVDTYRADKSVDLVPLEEARKKFALAPGKAFWKELENGEYVTKTQGNYDSDWWQKLESKEALDGRWTGTFSQNMPSGKPLVFGLTLLLTGGVSGVGTAKVDIQFGGLETDSSAYDLEVDERPSGTSITIFMPSGGQMTGTLVGPDRLEGTVTGTFSGSWEANRAP